MGAVLAILGDADDRTSPCAEQAALSNESDGIRGTQVLIVRGPNLAQGEASGRVAMRKVILVDDVQEIRELVAAFLIDEGFSVTACERAEEALDHIAASLPDLLILDGRLPGMSGWQCLELLRAAERTARLPVIVLTAALSDLSTSDPPDTCTAFLGKPFDLDNLLTAACEVTDSCRQQTVAV